MYDYDTYDAERFYEDTISYDEAECDGCGEHPDECLCDEVEGDFGGEDAYLDTYMEDRISYMYIGGDY